MQIKALVSLVLFFSGGAFACNCLVSPTPCAFYAVHHGQPTFVGKVIHEATVSDVIEFGGHIVPVTAQKVTFRVEKAFEGITEHTVNVYGSGTTCDLHFAVGKQYLVYGYRGEDGKIRTDRCWRTAEVGKAIEDLRFLRGLPSTVGGKIVGFVRFVNPREDTNNVGGRVIASGKDGDHQTRVDASGKYELDRLRIGDYRLTFTPDVNATDFIDFNVSVSVRGSCAETGRSPWTHNCERGSSGQGGQPVAGTEVLLFYALTGKFRPEVALRTRTDRNGSFTFHWVEAAKFILAAKASTSEMFFFPSTRNPSDATLVEVQEDVPLSGLTVRVPSPP